MRPTTTPPLAHCPCRTLLQRFYRLPAGYHFLAAAAFCVPGYYVTFKALRGLVHLVASLTHHA